MYEVGQVVMYQMGSEMGFSASEVPATILSSRVIDDRGNEGFSIRIHENGRIIEDVTLDGIA